MQKMNILNKKIIVIGASSDIGMELIPLINNKSNTIGVHGFSSVERLVKFENSNVIILKEDFSIPGNARKLINRYLDIEGNIDILIQLCGNISHPKTWNDLNEDDWNKDLNINLLAPFFAIQAALPKMNNAGKIVLMSTASAAKGGGTKTLPYGVAKMGIETLVKNLVGICSEKEILINAVCPGFIETRFQKEKALKSENEIYERSLSIPLKRAGTAKNVAKLIYYLISDSNEFITGQCVKIDGGDFI
jgi:NAD(P)-dependent dehydrogenase (short-subunit alcohol dehydrogenase family)